MGLLWHFISCHPPSETLKTVESSAASVPSSWLTFNDYLSTLHAGLASLSCWFFHSINTPCPPSIFYSLQPTVIYWLPMLCFTSLRQLWTLSYFPGLLSAHHCVQNGFPKLQECGMFQFECKREGGGGLYLKEKPDRFILAISVTLQWWGDSIGIGLGTLLPIKLSMESDRFKFLLTPSWIINALKILFSTSSPMASFF